MNPKKALLVFGFPLLLACTLPIRAQIVFDDSPQDPIAILAFLGGVCAIAAAMKAAHRSR